MGEFSKYPDIETLDKVPEIFMFKEVIITEKIHGTNIRFGCIEGKLRVGGRNQEFDLEKTDFMEFCKWFRENTYLQEQLTEFGKDKDVIVYGEWHGTGIQKGIKYCEGKDLRVFDIRINGNLLDWKDVKAVAEKLGLRTVPELYIGEPSLEIFDNLKGSLSVVAQENGISFETNTMEGIVIKPTKMFLKKNRDWVIAKYKDFKWEERASMQKSGGTPKIPQTAIDYVNEFVTEQRLEHVLNQLREEGINVLEFDSVGHVLRVMMTDLSKEAEQELKGMGTLEQKAVKKVATKKTKELFQKYVMREKGF